MSAAAALACIWLLRTKLGTGLFVVTFQPESVAGGRWEDTQGSALTLLRHLLTIPWQVHFDGWHAFEGIGPSANPMGFALILFGPPALFLAWRFGDLVRRMCWLYVVLYGILWGETLVLLRYSVGLIPVLMALTAGKVFDAGAWRGQRRILIAGALSYALAFGICGATNVTLSQPMLAYFSKHLNKDQYLSAVLDTYSATLAAKNAAAPGDLIFGLENCNTSYMKQVSRFYCEHCPDHDCDVNEVTKNILAADYRWLVFSRHVRYDGVVKTLAAIHPLDQIYADPLFVVYKWKNPTVPGIQ
jgi:hypothetical protein